MGSKPNITQEQVDKVKFYLNNERYQSLSMTEIGTLVGVSASTVSRVKKGEFDKPPEQPPAQELTATNPQAYTLIPYEELVKLIRYEMTIKELLDCCILSNISDELVFLPLNPLNRTLSRCIPEEYEAQLAELRLHKSEDHDTM